ncbi:MAG: GlsB/YeaQ/YmgE family stress response membrane protein, partial [Rhizomicrobium sp.]
GWLAGVIVKGAEFGLPGNIVAGIVGAFAGSWLLPRRAFSWPFDLFPRLQAPLSARLSCC